MERAGRTTTILILVADSARYEGDPDSSESSDASEDEGSYTVLKFTPNPVESLLLLLPDVYAERVVLHILGMHPRQYQFHDGNPVSTSKEDAEDDAEIKALYAKKRKLAEAAYERVYRIPREPNIVSTNVPALNLRLQAFLEELQASLKDKCPDWCSEELRKLLCAITPDEITIPSRVDSESPRRDGGPYKILVRRTKEGASWKCWTVSVTPTPLDRLLMDLVCRGHAENEVVAAICKYIHIKYGPGNPSTVDALLEDRIRHELDEDVRNAMLAIAHKRAADYMWVLDWYDDIDVPDVCARLRAFLPSVRLFMKMTRAKNELCEYLTYAHVLAECDLEKEIAV